MSTLPNPLIGAAGTVAEGAPPGEGPEWRGMVTTHDEAAQVLRYSALGATVAITPLRGPRADQEPFEVRQRTREFTLVLDSAPYHAVNARDLYTLPVRARALASRVRELLGQAQRAVSPLVLVSRPERG